jgi:hypothetical protein
LIRLFIIFLIIFTYSEYNIYSQSQIKNKKLISVYAGMGIDYGITPVFNDYLKDQIPYSNKDSISSFNAGIEFFGGVEKDFSKNISVKIDYSYYIRSVSYSFLYEVYDYSITAHQPYIFVNYLYKTVNYNMRFGLGLGYHFQQLDNKINQTTTLTYNSRGPGIRLEAAFSPKLSKNFWGYLSVFGFGNFYSKLKNADGNTLKAANSTTEADLSGYGVGARIGFVINLN